MKNLILPTDFSPNSYNAMKYAVQLFQKEKCTFYILNTYNPVLYTSGYLVDEIQKNNSKKNLLQVPNDLKKDFPNEDHTYKTISSFNLLNDEIEYLSKSKNIDMVIMGTQGATGADKVMFGTNTVQAIRKTACPLLAIPSDFKFSIPSNILFASDYETLESKNDLEPLKEIAADWNSRINVLHVLNDHEFTPKQAMNKNLLIKHLGEISHTFHSVKKNSVAKGIIQFQNENSMDLLAMISHKHSFFENLFSRPVTSTIGFQLTIPFLVIPLKNEK